MKTKRTLIIAVVIAATIGLSLNACKKDSSTTTNSSATETEGINTATSATASEMMYDDAFDVVSQSGEQGGVSTSSINSKQAIDATATDTASYTTTAGATITLTPADASTFPKTLTVNYGAGVTSANGVTRKGELIITLSGKIRAAGTTISVTYNNYSVNGYGLAGTYTMIPQIAADSGVNFSVTVTNGSITLPGGTVSTYSGAETFTQVGGIGSASVTDDTYQITGNFSYSSANTGAITGTVTTPLVKSADCKDIVSGVVALTYKGLSGTLDFGSGTCDNQATLTFGKTVKIITLAR